jgi:hypothetical protein
MSSLDRDAAEAGPPGQRLAVRATGWVCLGAVLCWIVHRVWPALFFPWWSSPDEVVFYYEVIRQLRLDPSQSFFDIPGTPFTTLASVLTALWWLAERLAGPAGYANPSDFAFARAQGVFTLMRALTMGLYLGAVALAFDLFRRSAGVVTAVVAAILLASLPIHIYYSQFVRTESLGLVLCLGAIRMVLYSRWRGTPAVYGCAGILAGVAMAARYHFALAGFPALLAVFFLVDREKLAAGPPASGHRALFAISAALAALFIAGAVVTAMFSAGWIAGGGLTDTMLLTTRAGQTQYTGAKEIMAKLWLLLGSGALAGALLHAFPRGRRWIWPAINPFTLMLGVGFAAGFLLSNPEFLWRGEQQLRSIQFYRDWTDPHLADLGPLRGWWKVAGFYFHAALPERWLQAAFLSGTAIVLWRRQAVHLALLAGTAIYFFAHPASMKLWPHHAIPWLPFFCFVAAVPAGLAGDWLARRRRHPAVAAAGVFLAASIMVGACATRLRHLNISAERTDRIAELNRWLAKNVPPEAYLLESYFALDKDGFLKWIEEAGVRIPEFVHRRANVGIWWLDRAAVDGRAGFICTTPADIAVFRDDFERRNPGSTYNPFEDPAFRPLARFGDGYYELRVFQFDFRAGRPAAASPAGVPDIMPEGGVPAAANFERPGRVAGAETIAGSPPAGESCVDLVVEEAPGHGDNHERPRSLHAGFRRDPGIHGVRVHGCVGVLVRRAEPGRDRRKLSRNRRIQREVRGIGGALPEAG